MSDYREVLEDLVSRSDLGKWNLISTIETDLEPDETIDVLTEAILLIRQLRARP